MGQVTLAFYSTEWIRSDCRALKNTGAGTTCSTVAFTLPSILTNNSTVIIMWFLFLDCWQIISRWRIFCSGRLKSHLSGVYYMSQKLICYIAETNWDFCQFTNMPKSLVCLWFSWCFIPLTLWLAKVLPNFTIWQYFLFQDLCLQLAWW